MKNVISFVIVLLIFSGCRHQAVKEIFVEAESFQHKGGWVVDPQFVEQMGSPYLLAHGSGSSRMMMCTR